MYNKNYLFQNQKTKIIKYHELVLRNYFELGNTDFFVFNKEKNESNGQADFVFHKSYKNALWDNQYVKLFYAIKGCNYKVGYNKAKTIIKKNNGKYRADKLNYIALCNGYESITLLTLEQFDKIISNIEPVFDENDNYKSFIIPFYVADEMGIVIRNKKSFYTVKEPEIEVDIKSFNKNLKSNLPEKSYCLPDKRVGKDYLFINEKGKAEYVPIHRLALYLVKDSTDTLAIKALDQKIRRYITDQKYRIENNKKIELFNYIGQREYNVYIIDTTLFDSTESFAKYQENADKKVNKTVDIKSYQKDYQGQICIYNGKEYKLGALVKKLQRAGIEKPTLEAKKYLVSNK